VGAADIEFLIRVGGSEYLKSVAALKSGDEVDIIGPMGSAFIPPAIGAVMIAGGTGVTPFLSVLRSEQESARCSLFVYTAKERSLYCRKEIEEIAQGSDKCKVFFQEGVLPRGGDFSPVVSADNNRPIFISGPQGFVDAVTGILLASGIKPERMRYEAVWPLSETSRQLKSLFFGLDAASWRVRIAGEVGGLPSIGDLFFQAIEQTSNHVTLTDEHGNILFANEAAEQMTGYTRGEMYGQTPRLWGGMMPPTFYEAIWDRKSGEPSVSRYFANRRRSGEIYYALGRITPLWVGEKAVAFIATEENVTPLVNLEKLELEFISIASHQLRTPLTGIKWVAERMLAKESLSSKGKEYIGDIQASAKNLSALVDLLLNVSRIEEGMMKVSPVEVEIIGFVQDIIEEAAPLREEKSLTIDFVHATGMITAQTDKSLVRNIIQALLSNAIEYTPVGGKITVKLEQSPGLVLMSIQDTGIGIPESEQSNLFGRFRRASNAIQMKPGGSGLGLYIAKQAVDLLEGKIWFISREGEGSTFFVEFPLISRETKGRTQLL